MTEAQPPALHPDLERARYGKNHDGDRFVGFWLELITQARQYRGRADARQARRTLERFWARPEVRRAVESVGVSAVHEQLLDAAAVYYSTCLTDPQYSSTLWRTNRIEPQKLRMKMAKETAGTLALMADSEGLTGTSQILPTLLTDGLLQTLAPYGAEELGRAVAGDPSAVRALEAAEKP